MLRLQKPVRVEDVARAELPLAGLVDAVVKASRRGDATGTKTCATEEGAAELRGEARRILLEEELLRLARLNRGTGLRAERIEDGGGYRHVELQTKNLRVTVKNLASPGQPLLPAAYRSRLAACSFPLFDGLLDVLSEDMGYLVLVYSVSTRTPSIPSYIALRDPSGQAQEISLDAELKSALAPPVAPTPTITEAERDEPVPQAKLRKKVGKARKNA